MDEFPHYDDNLSLPDDEDVFFPGQFDASMDDSLSSINDRLKQLEEKSEKNSKINRVRFVITTMISLATLAVALVSLILRV